MKGIISAIKRMEIHDGDGLRTTVFFKGCPLRCIWCHNPESLSFASETAFFKSRCVGCGACGGVRDESTAAICPTEAIYHDGREYTTRELVELLLEDGVFFARGGGVTLSGGECLAQADFARSVAKALCERNISVYIDTSGYARREVLDSIIPYAHKFLYDLKAIDPEVHKRCTGKDNALILENLRYLSDRGWDIEIRYPLVMGYNDGECEAIARLLIELGRDMRVKVLRYQSFAASRYGALGLDNTMPDTETTVDDVERAVNMLRSYGVDAINGALGD